MRVWSDPKCDMKSVPTPAAMCGASVAAGRVHRHKRDIENEEIQMYLSKLKELVPFMPKNRRLSKLEVIQHVIDYICDLQYALETHPVVVPAASEHVTASPAVRTPLGVLAPNSNVANTSCAAQDLLHASTPPHLEKVSSADSRPVSC